MVGRRKSAKSCAEKKNKKSGRIINLCDFPAFCRRIFFLPFFSVSEGGSYDLTFEPGSEIFKCDH